MIQPKLHIHKDPSFIVHQESPYNGEPPAHRLLEDFLTPTSLFYVRTHGNIPQIDASTYRVHIIGGSRKELSLTLADLRHSFTQRRLSATLQCAGNRREELMAVKPIPDETPWSAGAIGTAEWGGVPLSEVLQATGVPGDARHIACLGLDEVDKQGKTWHFGGSVPLDKALHSEVLLAYEMNGAPLEPAHGYPLRLVVPGYIGARSVKWLSEIRFQAEPSDNYFYTHSYRLLPSGMAEDAVDWSAGIPLGETNVNAAICLPEAHPRRTDGKMPIQVQGYAISGGERVIQRVEVSTDGGKTWQTARLSANDHPFTWRFWSLTLELGAGRHQILARAWDSAANTQPETASQVWNLKGYMNNAWSQATV